MAKIKKVLSRQLSASTLIEVVISLVIIMAVFVAGIAIFAQVTQSGRSDSSIAVSKQLDRIAQETKMARAYEDEILDNDTLVYYKSLIPFQDYPDLLILTIAAEQNGKPIGSLKQIIRKEKEDEN